MATDEANNADLQHCLDRLQAGDPLAREELFRRVGGRLERLARKMLRAFPGVHRWEETDDVLQSALLRLLRALRALQPDSPRAFFALTAEQLRRELLDLARHYYGPQGAGANHWTPDGGSLLQPLVEKADQTNEPSTLAVWCEFHRQVQRLPPAEREVVDLLFYQELTQAEAAGLLGMTVRTVQRRWQAALWKLHQILSSHGPVG